MFTSTIINFLPIAVVLFAQAIRPADSQNGLTGAKKVPCNEPEGSTLDPSKFITGGGELQGPFGSCIQCKCQLGYVECKPKTEACLTAANQKVYNVPRRRGPIHIEFSPTTIPPTTRRPRPSTTTTPAPKYARIPPGMALPPVNPENLGSEEDDYADEDDDLYEDEEESATLSPQQDLDAYIRKQELASRGARTEAPATTSRPRTTTVFEEKHHHSMTTTKPAPRNIIKSTWRAEDSNELDGDNLFGEHDSLGDDQQQPTPEEVREIVDRYNYLKDRFIITASAFIAICLILIIILLTSYLICIRSPTTSKQQRPLKSAKEQAKSIDQLRTIMEFGFDV